MNAPEPQGCLLAILRLFGLGGASRPPSTEPLPYRVRDDFLSPAELSFFRVLQLAAGGHVVIACKVNLGDMFFVAASSEKRAHRNRIDRKHVDFLLCSAKTMRPLVGIELDDSSHQRADRVERDSFVNEVFAAAGLPLLRVAARATYSPQQLAVDLAPYLIPAHQPVMQEVPPAGGTPLCPKCSVPMVQRVASKGANAGRPFWGCPNYPRCRTVA